MGGMGPRRVWGRVSGNCGGGGDASLVAMTTSPPATAAHRHQRWEPPLVSAGQRY